MKAFLSICALFAAGILGACPALAEAPRSGAWEIDGEHSTVGFRIRHIVGHVPGVFARFSGEVEYDPAAPDRAQFYILIDSASVHTGVPARDEHLRSPDFLDVEKFPRVIFASKSVSRGEGDALRVTGDLTIKDVTTEITVPVRVLGIADHPLKDRMPDTRVLGLQTQFSINRLDFHVGEARWTQMGVMGENIDLTIDMELLQR